MRKSPLPPTAPPLAPPAPVEKPSLRAVQQDAFDEELERFEGLVPPVLGKLLAYTQRPGTFHYRLPIALLFIVGGCAGFLPILGFWMVPVGLMLIVQDVRPARRPMSRALAFANRLLERHRERKGQQRVTRPRCCADDPASVACASLSVAKRRATRSG